MDGFDSYPTRVGTTQHQKNESARTCPGLRALDAKRALKHIGCVLASGFQPATPRVCLVTLIAILAIDTPRRHVFDAHKKAENRRVFTGDASEWPLGKIELATKCESFGRLRALNS